MTLPETFNDSFNEAMRITPYIPFKVYSINNDAQTPRHLLSILHEAWFNVLAQILSNLFLFILVFGMSATVEVQHLRQQVHNKFAILTGLATQFIIMPLFGYLKKIN